MAISEGLKEAWRMLRVKIFPLVIAIETIFAIEIEIYLFQYIPIYTLTYPYFDGKMAKVKGNVKLMVYRESM